MATEAPVRGTPVEPYDAEGIAAGMEALMKQNAAGAAAPAATEPETLETPETPQAPETLETPETPETPEAGAPEKPETPAVEDEKSTEDALQELQAQREAEAAAKAKPKEEKKPVVEERKPEVVERDKDLEVPDQSSAHLHPKTRKLINQQKEKAIAARNERDAIAAEKAALQAQLDEAKKAATQLKVPKEVEDELKTLRERVRELDISRDPAIETKYDKPVTANNDRIISTLKEFGLGKRLVDGKPVEAPEDVTNLVKAGLTLKNVKPFIDKLDELGEVDAAEAIREALRENNRLARAKQQEIEAFKADFQGRTEAKTHAQQQQAEQYQASIRTTADKIYKTDLAEIAKQFPYISEPPAIDPKDAPAVAQAKQKAIDEYNAVSAQVNEAVKGFSAAGLPPEKQIEAQGRLAAAAVKGIQLSLRVLPRVAKDIAAKDARIKELETQLNGIRKAGTVSRAHAAAASTGGTNQPLPTDTKDAFAQIARERGISVDVNS